MDVRKYNRSAWDGYVENKNPYTLPVSAETIAAARRGEWMIYLTDSRPAPAHWFPPLMGCDVLCLASGGGQQGPVLAAAGANVTIFDNSPKQLAQDRFVAQRDGLELVTVEGDMADLSGFADRSFDLIVHPISNLFVPDVRPVWAEAFRMLRPGGALLAGFMNPVGYVFDRELEERGIYQVKYRLPYSDLTALSEADREKFFGPGAAVEFGHNLEDQIGGQIEAGFVLAGFFEEYRQDDPIGQFMPTFIATRALKLKPAECT